MTPRPVFTPDVLGIGCVYSSNLHPLFMNHADLVDIIEVEPQTLWYSSGPHHALKLEEESVRQIADYGKPVVLHGVNNPVGGKVRPDNEQARLFAELAKFFVSPWVSEHLSFNRVNMESGPCFTGFMLPPLQTDEGVDEAVLSIQHLARFLPCPLAIEPGVSYFRPESWEMPDGAFVAEVCRQADCGILLDLHNIWTNARNGRQSVEGFLSSIPLERVWELHLAGGSERHGFWLDSHEGPIPAELLALARELVPDLPNLGAMIYELFPVNLPALGMAGVCRQLEAMQDIWTTRTERRKDSRAECVPRISSALKQGRVPTPAQTIDSGAEDPVPKTEEWEQRWFEALRRAARKEQGDGHNREDPGVRVVAELIGDFRAAMVVQNLQLTSSLLFLSVGADWFRACLSEYGASSLPSDYAVHEALGFAEFLSDRKLLNGELERLIGSTAAIMGEVLAFEQATLRTLLDHQSRTVRFTRDPLPLLYALGEGRLPEDGSEGRYEIEITP